jgi:hypothetical protein
MTEKNKSAVLLEYSLKKLKLPVGDIESVPKSDIGGQADMGMRTDRCLKFPA